MTPDGLAATEQPYKDAGQDAAEKSPQDFGAPEHGDQTHVAVPSQVDWSGGGLHGPVHVPFDQVQCPDTVHAAAVIAFGQSWP